MFRGFLCVRVCVGGYVFVHVVCVCVDVCLCLFACIHVCVCTSVCVRVNDRVTGCNVCVGPQY